MGFIKFHNVFMENGEYKLTPLDWEYYSLIASCWSPFSNTSRISIAYLTEIQNYYNNKVESINRKNVKDKVWSLNSRGIINILTPEDKLYVDVGSKKQFDYTKTLEIYLNEFETGYEEISNNIHDLSTDVNERFSINCIYRFHMMYIVEKKIHRGFTKSLKEWENLLSCSEHTAKDTIERLLQRNIIIREGWNKTQLESGQYKSTPYEYFMNVEVLNGNQPVIEYVKEDKVIELDSIEVIPDVPEVEVKNESYEIVYGNWKGGNNLTPDDYILYAKQEDNDEFMKVAESKIMRISGNRTKDKTVYAIEKAIEKGRDTVNEVKYREIATQNTKIKNDNINLIRNCKGIPIVENDDVVHDMLIDDIDNLTLKDKIYWLDEQEKTEHGYYTGMKVTIEEDSVICLIKGEKDSDDSCEFIKFNMTNIEFLFSEFKRIIRETGVYDINTLRQLTAIRKNLIDEQSEGLNFEEDWEGDKWLYDHPNPDPVNKSKQNRRREHERHNRMGEENQRMELINKEKNEDDMFTESLFE